MKKRINLIASVFLLSLVLLSLVSAFGVASPYWDDNPLVMARGETKIVNLNAQNMVGDEDVLIKAELISGQEIASFEDNTYLIKAKTSDTKIPLKISIPRDAEPGMAQGVQVTFKTISQNGGISLGTGMSVSFNVLVSEETIAFDYVPYVVACLIILLIIILIVVLKKKKIIK